MVLFNTAGFESSPRSARRSNAASGQLPHRQYDKFDANSNCSAFGPAGRDRNRNSGDDNTADVTFFMAPVKDIPMPIRDIAYAV